MAEEEGQKPTRLQPLEEEEDDEEQRSASAEGDDLNDFRSEDEREMQENDDYEEDDFLVPDDPNDDHELTGEARVEAGLLLRRTRRNRQKRIDKGRVEFLKRIRDQVAGEEPDAKRGRTFLAFEQMESESASGRGTPAGGEPSEGGGDEEDEEAEEVEEAEEKEEFGSEEASDEEVDDVELVDSSEVSLVEWLASDEAKFAVKRHFRKFLRQSQDGEAPYIQSMKKMVGRGGRSLAVHYIDVYKASPKLALYAVDSPSSILPLFTEVATAETARIYPSLRGEAFKVHIRVQDLPVTDSIRSLRCIHMGRLIRVRGVVTRRSQVYPQLRSVRFDCMQCGNLIGPLMVHSQEAKVYRCPQCQTAGPFRFNSSQVVYRNYQTVVLQERPGSMPPGRLPRHVECILTDDLVDQVRPGEDVDVTGIYQNSYSPSMNSRQGFPVFSSSLEINSIKAGVAEDLDNLPQEERQLIEAIANHPNCVEKIIASIAPSIHGNEHIKEGLACSLFGAVSKPAGGRGGRAGEGSRVRLRGDINVLLIGDPGCGKSQFLKYVESTSPRAVFTTGRGSTAVGLTAAVQRDPMTGEWTLEGGALVIADQGHCLIDEFDKMSDADRTSIHEAMEQQTISIAKAGVVTQLQARCAVIAAANPTTGSYNPSQPFEQQCNLSQPILSRFDLLFAVKDAADSIHDGMLARFIVNSHIRNWRKGALSRADFFDEDEMNEEEETKGLATTELKADTDPSTTNPLPQQFLRRYIGYARKINPSVERLDFSKIEDLYASLRNEHHALYENGMRIVVRHLESIIRLSESFARMRLAHFVRPDDVDRAISLFLKCFLRTMPTRRQRELTKKYSKFLTPEKQTNQALFHALTALAEERRRMHVVKYGSAEGREVAVDFQQFRSAADHYNIGANAINKFLQYPRLKECFRVVSVESKGIIRNPLEDVKEFILL
eukprot:Hpha_TRINITY_DN15531_c4_g3::TRINITY_DN15531_c4_g3_i1::g.105459::m.105459/K02540/MCM2; DNA replication licensing factor MCM2